MDIKISEPSSPTILSSRTLPHSNGNGAGMTGINHVHQNYKPLLRRMGSIKKEPYFANLRQQLQEQLRSLDTRVETQALLTSELQDYFRKRAEVELEYSRSLDKLTKSLVAKQKEVKQKRDQINLFSITNCWSQLIAETKKQSQEHGILSEIYNNYITSRFSFVIDDLQRVYRKCRDIGSEAHEELLKVLQEFHTSTKTFHTYQTESKTAENKLRLVEGQKAKLELIIPREKHEKSKKLRLVDKEIEKKSTKYTEARIKSLKAKNEYLLCMDAANSAVQKYFVDDLSDLIDCMDLGFYQCITRIMNAYISTQQQMSSSINANVDQLTKCVSNLDSRLDKQKFLELNNSVFIMPKKLEFQGTTLKGEEAPDTTEPAELSTVGYMKQELEQRLVQLHHRLNTLRTESDELWKTLETAESTLLEMLTLSSDSGSFDVKQLLIAAADENSKTNKQPEAMLVLKWRADRHETDEFHLEKFHNYMLSTNLIARLQAKYDHIRKILNETDGGAAASGGLPAILVQALHGNLQSTAQQDNKLIQNQPRRRKRIGQQLHHSKKPKLFGGSLEEYIECTGQEIPLVMKSCIRIINLYGLHHQGLFRVSGSQLEINHFRDAFESGEDPLVEATDASDINSIAGVFKLYLRELREPLFPIVYFEQFMELAQLESKHSLVMQMRDLVKSLPRSVFVVLRYLFAFLNHLSEFSDENMMDPYNIAICFGPTLVPVPEDKDQILKLSSSLVGLKNHTTPMFLCQSDTIDLQVQYQNLVNELIKNLIIFAEEIFPNDGGGIIYEKYLSHHSGGGKHIDDSEIGDEYEIGSVPRTGIMMDQSLDDEIDTSDMVMSDDESDSSVIEAVAQYNFNARSPRELSFCKGDSIKIYSQVSNDWWNGSVHGTTGLVPDKYISIISRRKDEPQKKSAHQKQRVTTTTSDSFLHVVPSGSQENVPSPSSSKSSPVYYSTETHPSRLHHHHHHQKSSSISGAQILSQSKERKVSEEPSLDARSTQSAKTETIIMSANAPTMISSQELILQKPLNNRERTDIKKEEQFQREDDSEESSCRSHSISISMPKSVENEAIPTQALLVIEEDDQIVRDSRELSQPIQFAQSEPNNSKVQPATTTPGGYTNVQSYWESMKQCKQQRVPASNTHPDLVMDLPNILPSSITTPASGSSSSTNSGSSSDDSSSPTLESPDSANVNLTAAECFAKQNQCTLKKNSRNPVGPSAIAAAAAAAAICAGEIREEEEKIHENPFLKMKHESKPSIIIKKPQVKVKPVLKSSFVPSSSSSVLHDHEPTSCISRSDSSASSHSSSSSCDDKKKGTTRHDYK